MRDRQHIRHHRNHVTWPRSSSHPPISRATPDPSAVPSQTRRSTSSTNDWADADGRARKIAVSGDGVSLGYSAAARAHGRALRAGSVRWPSGQRLYRSGDTGHVLRNGEIAFHGRVDHQVKIRGHRVELAEVEAAFVEHRRQRGRGDCEGSRRREPDAGGVREAQRSRRASRARRRRESSRVLARTSARGHGSARIQFVGALPRTSTGRRWIVRRWPREPGACASGRGYSAPRNDREQTLVRIWQEVLGRTPIGIAENFFDIGGDSILCMQICARAARAGDRGYAKADVRASDNRGTVRSSRTSVDRHAGRACHGTRAASAGAAMVLRAGASRAESFQSGRVVRAGPGIGAADVEAALRGHCAHRRAPPGDRRRRRRALSGRA